MIHRGFATGKLTKITAFLFLLFNSAMIFKKMNAFEHGENLDLFCEFGFFA